ncbi:pyridoxamine 5'-phosphate oxidase family protein [Rothia sp. AR01]|uniref:Pyridoxamine 5'-phosphate oxidase family protein n=1 Tax=Rothia santali TaxID=2949643 RepID=A0A9X2HBD2_9MICC|nr:pyridoxamine 5'-phosphate oxidase family protein [Rothia santali]MCP3426201.1 pyridoxamine 5'-phosphate oxidase family protein [Rothia santali]
MSESELNQDKVVEIMRGERLAMLTCIAHDGKLHSHPMTPQEVTDDADVWFFIGLRGEQADELRTNPEVNLAFAETGSWLSVAGRAVFEDDRSKIEELWNDDVSKWFDGGKDDPNLGLIRVVGDSAQFWGQPGGKVASIAELVKAKVTGQRPAGGSGTTEL